jgi:acetyltransferase-like isoleucine patch superfamily enzyme
MNIFLAFFTKVFIYFFYKKDQYLFWRSKKYIDTWGEGTYGIPAINCYDKLSKVSVGSYCSIASEVSFLLGANHKGGLVTTYPIDRIEKSKSTADASERGNINIGSDVWIGYRATIIGEVSIGDGAIIGAGALVVDDVPAYAVVGGVPAKVIKYRFEKDVIEKLLKIKWWSWDKDKVKENFSDIYTRDIDGFIKKYS